MTVRVWLLLYDYVSEINTLQKRRGMMQSAEAELETTDQSGFTKQQFIGQS